MPFCVCMKAETLKQAEGKSQVHLRKIVDEVLSLMAQETEGIKFEKCSVVDQSKMQTQPQKKAPKKVQSCFLLVRSSTTARGWNKCMNGAAQLKKGWCLPRASLLSLS